MIKTVQLFEIIVITNGGWINFALGERRINVISKCCNASEIFNAKSNSCENGNFSLLADLTFFKFSDGNPIKKFCLKTSKLVLKS